MQNTISITKYEAICNLGNSIDEIFNNALKSDNDFFTPVDSIVKFEI